MNNTINFEEASREWRRNKKAIKGGSFFYKCKHFSHTNNNYCNNRVIFNGYCKYHWNTEGCYENSMR